MESSSVSHLVIHRLYSFAVWWPVLTLDSALPTCLPLSRVPLQGLRVFILEFLSEFGHGALVHDDSNRNELLRAVLSVNANLVEFGFLSIHSKLESLVPLLTVVLDGRTDARTTLSTAVSDVDLSQKAPLLLSRKGPLHVVERKIAPLVSIGGLRTGIRLVIVLFAHEKWFTSLQTRRAFRLTRLAPRSATRSA